MQCGPCRAYNGPIKVGRTWLFGIEYIQVYEYVSDPGTHLYKFSAELPPFINLAGAPEPDYNDIFCDNCGRGYVFTEDGVRCPICG